MSLLVKVLAYLGAIYGSILTYKLLRLITFWTRTGSLPRYKYKHSNQDPWAFITGSSDGIGLALAQELASSSFNIILHGRNPIKLEAAKKTILSEFPSVQVRYVVTDVCIPGDNLLVKIQEIVDELKDLHITVLINNVGGPAPKMNPLFKPFWQTAAWEIDDQLAMNVRFTCHLTSLLIPLFLQKSKPALIINISSRANVGLPYLAMYSGGKGFIDSWTVSLRREMQTEGKDIEVLCVVPMKVTGTSFRKEKSEWMMPDSRTFARGTLNRIGGDQAVTEGYWSHGIMSFVTGSLPEWILMKVIVKAMAEEAEKDKKRE
jgi:17beta-estradiol 17-dehydrogenase / very-long-chain 3-oxoacyl-CoA reductase